MANQMSDFEYIKWILKESYLCTPPNHLTMMESKGDNLRPQIVNIKNSIRAITNIALYRFDVEENGNFLPFFNDKNGSPERLNAFCDYIALLEHNGKLIIFLLELKRGSTAGMEDQIFASYEFMQYILKSADRIKNINNMPDFNIDDIEFRRILIRKKASNKHITKPKEIKMKNKQSIIIYDCDSTIHLHPFI